MRKQPLYSQSEQIKHSHSQTERRQPLYNQPEQIKHSPSQSEWKQPSWPIQSKETLQSIRAQTTVNTASQTKVKSHTVNQKRRKRLSANPMQISKHVTSRDVLTVGKALNVSRAPVKLENPKNHNSHKIKSRTETLKRLDTYCSPVTALLDVKVISTQHNVNQRQGCVWGVCLDLTML